MKSDRPSYPAKPTLGNVPTVEHDPTKPGTMAWFEAQGRAHAQRQTEALNRQEAERPK